MTNKDLKNNKKIPKNLPSDYIQKENTIEQNKNNFKDRLLIALEESEDIISGKIPAKKYKNFDEMIEDLET